MNRMLSIALIIFMGLPGVAFGQSAKDAVKALKKLEARTETGINYKDFSAALADTKVEVESFLNSKLAKKNPELSECLKKTLEHYMISNELISEKRHKLSIAMGKLDILESDAIYTDSPLGKMIMRKYPRIEPSKPSYPRDNKPYYLLQIVIPEIWGEASKELKKYDLSTGTIKVPDIPDIPAGQRINYGSKIDELHSKMKSEFDRLAQSDPKNAVAVSVGVISNVKNLIKERDKLKLNALKYYHGNLPPDLAKKFEESEKKTDQVKKTMQDAGAQWQ